MGLSEFKEEFGRSEDGKASHGTIFGHILHMGDLCTRAGDSNAAATSPWMFALST